VSITVYYSIRGRLSLQSITPVSEGDHDIIIIYKQCHVASVRMLELDWALQLYVHLGTTIDKEEQV